MRQAIRSEHKLDQRGMPAGGSTTSTGLVIEWQNGPLQVDGQRLEPTGCFVETVIAAALDRLEWYQEGDFACEANRLAIRRLGQALSELDLRTRERTARGVEGTHQV